ncbi:MAG: nicotinate-nucleotide adenylyltransferase, partial [Pseudomonadota bacterium]
PAGHPPHREGTWADADHRLAMLELALAPYPDLNVDDREIHRAGPSFMVDTLASLREEVDDAPILLCVGQDAANGLNRWHRWRDLFDLAHLVIMTRPLSQPRYPHDLGEMFEERRVTRTRDLMSTPKGRVRHVEITQLAISSTDIRRQLASGRDPRFLLPVTVLAYIQKHGLYR